MFSQTYAAIRMLNALVSDVYMSFMVPVGKMMIIGLVIFCVYSATRLGGFIALSLGFMGVTLTGLTIALYLTMAQMHALSVEIREDLKSGGFLNGKTRTGKVMKSLPHLKFWMGSEMYYCDRMLVLTIARTIAEQSCNFLIGNPA